MRPFEQKEYPAFSLFSREMALVTAGSMEHFNGCTIGWGSLGNLWSRGGSAGPTVTVYVYPSRYTCSFLLENPTFTVSFFPPEYRKALGYMGSHSGRDGDKVKAAGLTPVPMGDSVTYREAHLTFLCRKLYQHAFAKKDLAPEIQAYYQASPAVYPPDERGDWQAHVVFVGEVIDVDDRR